MVLPRIPHDPDELVALVDEKGKVIGRATRRKAHLAKKLHMITALLILNKGRLLLQTRTDNNLLDYSAGGHLKWNMTDEEGVVKEAFEELGIIVPASDIKRIGKWSAHSNSTHLVSLFEVIGDWRKEDFNIDPNEVKSVRYYTVPELKHLLKCSSRKFTMGFRYSLKRYLRIKGL